MTLESESKPAVQTTSSDQVNEDEIFEREYQTVMENREYMADLTRKLIALEELNGDMALDTQQMFSIANRPLLPVQEGPQAKGKPLGPEGTELIDETFRPPPAELGVYPQHWVTHQSTLLQSQPTEPNIS